jgi:hypothetical protein
LGFFDLTNFFQSKQTSSSEEYKQKQTNAKKKSHVDFQTFNSTPCPTPAFFQRAPQSQAQPSQFTSRVGYKQNEPNAQFFRNKSNIFVHPQVHQPLPQFHQIPRQFYASPLGPQVLNHPPPTPLPHHFQMPTYINEYGQLNFLNNRYGYKENPKLRSESRMFNTDNTSNTPVNPVFNYDPLKDARKAERAFKFLPNIQVRNSKPGIYSNFRNINGSNNQRTRRLDRVLSFSSVCKTTQKNALKRDLSKLYRKNPGLYFQNLKNYNKSATVMPNIAAQKKPTVRNEGNYSNLQQSFVKQQDANLNKTVPTYFQPGYYPCDPATPFQNMNQHTKPIKIFY